MYESAKKRGRPPGPYGEYNKVRIGADPEFELHKQGRFFPANQVLQGLHTPLGVDGNSDTGEIRPCLNGGGRMDTMFYRDKEAGPGVATIIERLALKLNELFEVYAGSGCHRPIGGHLHISGVEESEPLILRFDLFIALPLNEVSDTRVRHSSHYSYGKLGQTRPQPWGFEYRSPCSWISTPVLVKGVLSITWLLVQAQKHGCLDRFQSFEDFLEYPRKGHAENVRKFVASLGELKQRNKKLEEIEVLKAWDKRHLLKPIPSPEKPYQVEFLLSDECMPDIAAQVGPLYSPIPLRFVGARYDRAKSNAIFLPSGWRTDLAGFEAIRRRKWDLPWVGLSLPLRRNVPLAAQVIREIVQHTTSRVQ